MRPDVVIVSIDTLRPDRLGCYGASLVETPAIDRVAGAGVRFDAAFSPLPLTLPAHWAMQTGIQPWHLGIVDNGMTPGPLPVSTLAERFAGAGYETAAFVASFILNRTFGLNRGFETYDDGPAADAALDQALHGQATAGERVDRVLTWLRRPRQRPFFLWLHLYDPHAPYQPPSAFRSRYADRPYDGEVAYVDTQLDRLMHELDKRAAAAPMLVVFVSDHGESLGEHGERTHGLLLYDATLHVPLIFRFPGSLPAGAVRRDPVTLADVAPTVLALAGLPAARDLDGRDLFAPHPPTEQRQLVAISEATRRRFGWSRLIAVRDGPWKYIKGPRPELYDVLHDHEETLDLLAQPNLARPTARALPDLQRLAQRTSTELDARLALSTAAEPSPEDRARLAALGYLSLKTAPERDLPNPRDRIGAMNELDRAIQLLSDGRLDEAEQALVPFLVATSPPRLALESLGRIAELRGDPATAERFFRQVLEIEPDSVTTLAQVVRLERERGNIAGATADARHMTSLAPADGAASRLYAESLAAGGDTAGAEKEWRRGLAAAPDAAWLRLSFARFLHRAGRRSEALNQLDHLPRSGAGDDLIREAQALRALVEVLPSS
ncbi:MAG: sulfatase-like hydrolase/transferase [Thermoanaerobaculia bacterium]